MHRDRWLALGVGVLLASCGVSDASKSERVAQVQAKLALPPQISPDFEIDRGQPDVNRNATLLSVAAGTPGSYLLTYSVLHTPDDWSRITLGVRMPAQSSTELVFLQWDSLSGAPTTLARGPIGSVQSALTVDVGNGWLVVYEEQSETGIKRYLRTLARDGSLGTPAELPIPTVGSGIFPCQPAMQGLVRGGSSVLLTDRCGTALLLDLAGNVLSSLTIATPSAFKTPPVAGTVQGGQVAFNGIDYLVLYAFYPDNQVDQALAQVSGFPITPGGAVASPILIAKPRVPNWARVSSTGIVANGSAFLTLLRQSRASGSEADFTYRIALEQSNHTFTFEAERNLPGVVTPDTPTDRQVTPLALNGHFVIARLPYTLTGPMQLIYPSSDPALPDAWQPLPGALPGGTDFLAVLPQVSTDSQNSDGKRLLFASNAQAVRFDDTLHLIDDPSAALLSSLRGQFMPSFAFNGQQFLATWTETILNALGTNQDSPQIYGQHLSSTGSPLDQASFRLSPAGQSHRDGLFTANPAQFAGVWFDFYADGGAATLTTDEPPVLTSFALPSPRARPSGISTDGVHSIVAVADAPDIQVGQFGSGGSWSPTLNIEAVADSTATAPVLAFNAGQYTMLWTGADEPGKRAIYGVRFSASLALLDNPPKKKLLQFSAPDLAGHPGLSGDCGLELIASGDHFLFAWADVVGNVEELRVARLSKTLALLDPSGVLVATQAYPPPAFSTRRVALGWDGSYDWVVWTDAEGGARRPFASLRARRFSDNLEPADADPVLISNDLDELSKVTLAVGAEGSSLVGYTRYSPSEDSYRVRARFLSVAPFADGLPCSSAAQCQGGFCVASLCSAVSGPGGSAGSAGTGSGGTPGGNTGGNTGGGGTAGSISVGGNVGGPAGGDSGGGVAGSVSAGGDTGTAGSVATGGDSGGGIAGSVSVGGTTDGGSAGSGQIGDAGNVSAGGDGGSELVGGATASGGEATDDAGASDGGNSVGGSSGHGHAGSAGTKSGGGGSKDHSCSVRVAGAHSPSENLVSLAGLVTAVCWLRRRRNRSAA